MEKLDVKLIDLHDQIDYDRSNLINILEEIDTLYLEDPIPKYTILLYLCYISLSDLSNCIKEYFVLKNIIIHKF